MATIVYLFGPLLIFILMGIPIAISIGIAALLAIYLLSANVNLTIIPSQMFSGMDSFALMAIPFFILAGEIMNRSGITSRIINLAEALVGNIKGGLAQVNIVASTLLSGVSGSAAADAAAIGTSMIPNMIKRGYGKDFSAILTASAATVGPVIPPSVVFILYGFLTNVSIGKLFLGGVIPGIMMSIGLIITTYFVCKARGYEQVTKPFNMKKLKFAAKDGLLALAVPLVILISIRTGLATATESGVIAVFVSFIIGFFIFKTLRTVKAMRHVLESSVHTTAVIFFILATSTIFSNILIRSNFQDMVMNALYAVANTPFQMMLCIIVFILLLGIFIEVTPLLIMFATPLAAVGDQIGYDPVFFGVVLCIGSIIGAITPPVGGLLFITCSIAKVSIADTFKILIPYTAALVIVLLIIVIFPDTVTWLPNLLME